MAPQYGKGRKRTGEYYYISTDNGIFFSQESYKSSLIQTLEKNKDPRSFGFSNNYPNVQRMGGDSRKICNFCFPLQLANNLVPIYNDKKQNSISHNSLGLGNSTFPNLPQLYQFNLYHEKSSLTWLHMLTTFCPTERPFKYMEFLHLQSARYLKQ
jgi:hypothetical protein